MYTVQSLAAIKTPLVNKFYMAHKVKGRAKTHDQVWVVYCENHIVAACRIQIKPEFLFLSTVFVAPNFRQQGIATKLVCTVIQHYKQTIYTFAYADKVGFYTALGFNQVLTYTPALQNLFDIYSHRNIQALQYL